MAGQGCVNEGDDKRFMGWLICPLQNLLSWKSESPPKLIVGNLPYYGIFWPPYVVVQYQRMVDQWPPKPPYPDGSWRLFRLGFRYDNNWRGYIFPTGAWKIVSESDVMEKGY